MRFILPELRDKMAAGLDEIRSGQFAEEWSAEQAVGSPTLEILKDAARSLPLYQHEQELRQALGGMGSPGVGAHPIDRESSGASRPAGDQRQAEPGGGGWFAGLRPGLRRWWSGKDPRTGGQPAPSLLAPEQIEPVLAQFLVHAADDPALQEFSQGRQLTTHYALSEPEIEFYLSFDDGAVSGELGAPETPAQVRLEARAEVLDGMFTGRINAMRAAMTGRLRFSGDTKLAISIQQIQDDLQRLYCAARSQVVGP
jgi:putative sterol carrier protein